MVAILICAAPLAAYSVYHLLCILVSIFCSKRYTFKESAKLEARVAILYLTCDDFSQEACQSILNQKNISFHLFILDDSISEEYQEAVSKWVRKQANSITLVRRNNRKHYKGGNINNWLEKYAKPNEYHYTLILDADQVIEPEYTWQMVNEIQNTNLAFVQSSHSGRKDLREPFQKLLSLQVDTTWMYEVPARENLGIMPSLGHGVLFRTKDLQDAEGFPPVVSEDLGLTIRLALLGRFGKYLNYVTGFESFPKSYRDYWKRRRRWITADAEIIKKMLPLIWRSKLGVQETLDFTFRETRLAVGSLYWLLLVLICIAESSSLLEGHYFSSPYILMFVVMIAPVLTALLIKKTDYRTKLCYILVMPFIGAASSSINLPATIQGLNGHSAFTPTGSNNNGTGERPYILIEVLSSVLFIYCGLCFHNHFLLSMGLALLCSPALRRLNSKSGHCIIVAASCLFWLLILEQVASHIIGGSVPLTHFFCFLGITLTLS